MFFILSYYTFGGLASLPPLLTERPVFYMQRDAKYYKTLPYLMASIIAEVPTCTCLLPLDLILLLLSSIPTDSSCGSGGDIVCYNHILDGWTEQIL